MLPGLQDEEYAEFDTEIENYLDIRAAGLEHSPVETISPEPGAPEYGAQP
jgi:hypothetical protein